MQAPLTGSSVAVLLLDHRPRGPFAPPPRLWHPHQYPSGHRRVSWRWGEGIKGACTTTVGPAGQKAVSRFVGRPNVGAAVPDDPERQGTHKNLGAVWNPPVRPKYP
jgi:hypothetical protein